MAKLTQLATDLKKLEEGVWIPHPDIPEVEFKIGSLKSQRYEQAARKFMKAKRKTLSKARLRAMTTWESMQLIAPVVAEHVLLGWKGIDDENDEPIEYSIQAAREILADERYRAVYDFVLEYANDGDEFRLTEDEDDLGNSES